MTCDIHEIGCSCITCEEERNVLHVAKKHGGWFWLKVGNVLHYFDKTTDKATCGLKKKPASFSDHDCFFTEPKCKNCLAEIVKTNVV